MRVAQLSIAVLLFSLISTTVGAEQAIQWRSDLESAKREARETNRPILVHFWSSACAPCVRLDQQVYSLPEVKHALEAMFVPVRLKVEDEPGTVSLYGVRSWPADVILTPDGRFVALLKCPPVAGQYLAQLTQVTGGVNPLGGTALANMNPAAGGPSTQPVSNPAATNVQPLAHAVATAPPQVTAISHHASPGTTGRVQQYDWSGSGAASGASGGGVGSAYQPLTGSAYGASTPTNSSLPGSQSPSVSAASFNSVESRPLTSHYELVSAKDAPPLGLDGFCPVQLGKPQDKRQALWVKGDPRYGVVHRGRTYLFSSQEAQQEFLRNPDHYSPVMSGNDPVLLVENSQQVPGRRELGLFFGDRVYLFATKESQAKFKADMRKYAEVVYQAENGTRGMLR